jgi:hypothetical protein
MKRAFALATAPALAALLHGCAVGGLAGAAAGVGRAAAGAAVQSATGAVVNSATGAVVNTATGAVANPAAGGVVQSATGAMVNSATGSIANSAAGAITNSATGAVANTATGTVVNSAAGAMVKSATGAAVQSAIGAAAGGQSAIANAFIQTMASQVVNGQIGQQVQSADQDWRLQRLGELMQSGKLDQPHQWYNPLSGNTLAVRPLGAQVMDPSRRQPCQDLEETYTVANGRQLREMRRACQDSAEQWVLVQ